MGTAGCISVGGPSYGRIELANETSEAVVVGVSVETTAGTAILKRDERVPAGGTGTVSFEFERDHRYDVELEFGFDVADVECGENVRTTNWSATAATLDGVVDFSSSDQVYTLRIRDDRELSLSLDVVGVP